MTQPRYEVSYAPLAIDDLRGIHHYIAHVLQVPNTARRQVRRIETALQAVTLRLTAEVVDLVTTKGVPPETLRANPLASQLPAARARRLAKPERRHHR